MKKRLVIITEIIAPYRIPVFNALARMDEIDLHVIFLAKTDPTLRQWAVYEEEIRFSYDVLQSYRRRLGRMSILLNRGLPAALRNVSPHAIVCGGYNYIASWQALAWARQHRVRFILWIESNAKDSRKNNFVIEFLKKKFLASCDGFVVPGKASKQYLLGFKIPESKIFISPNAVDNKLFQRASDLIRSEGAMWRKKLGLPFRYFLFVGRIVGEKGVFDLLSAYGTLSPELRREVGLVFVGDGPARTRIEHRAKEFPESSIQFRGFIQRDELAAYYSLAEALVFPTHSDPWGLAVNEAMACRLPIISSEVAGCAADLVDHEWNGYVVPANDIQRLAQALEKMAHNTKLAQMGENSRLRIFDYSPELCAQGIVRSALAAGAV